MVREGAGGGPGRPTEDPVKGRRRGCQKSWNFFERIIKIEI